MKDVSKSMEELLARVDHAIAELQREVAVYRKETDDISIELFIASVNHLEEAFVTVREASGSAPSAYKLRRQDVLPAEA